MTEKIIPAWRKDILPTIEDVDECGTVLTLNEKNIIVSAYVPQIKIGEWWCIKPGEEFHSQLSGNVQWNDAIATPQECLDIKQREDHYREEVKKAKREKTIIAIPEDLRVKFAKEEEQEAALEREDTERKESLSPKAIKNWEQTIDDLKKDLAIKEKEIQVIQSDLRTMNEIRRLSSKIMSMKDKEIAKLRLLIKEFRGLIIEMSRGGEK